MRFIEHVLNKWETYVEYMFNIIHAIHKFFKHVLYMRIYHLLSM